MRKEPVHAIVSPSRDEQTLHVDVDDQDMPLLYALRDILNLKGRASDAACHSAEPAPSTSMANPCDPV
jgi:hypothetical protein